MNLNHDNRNSLTVKKLNKVLEGNKRAVNTRANKTPVRTIRKSQRGNRKRNRKLQN